MYGLVEPPPKFGLSLPELVSSRLGRPILTKNRRKNLRRAHEVMTDDPSETVFHAFNAVMDVLQRRIVDEKDVKVLEDLQKQKRSI